MLPAEGVGKGEDLRRLLAARVDHDAVGARRHISGSALQSVFHPLFEDKALDARDDHEIVRALRLLTRRDLRREVLDRVLLLLDLRAEERVLLEADLVLQDHGGDAHALQGVNVVDEVLDEAARIGVEDDWLRRHVHDVVDRADARRHVDELDVGLALRRRVAEARYPKRVELVEAALVLDDGLLRQKPREPVVHLDGLDDGHDLQQAAQAAAAKLRHDEPFLHALVDLLDGRVPRIGHLDELAARLREVFQHIPADQ